MTPQQEIDALGLNAVAFIALPSALLVLTTVCLALRIYVRSSLIKAWGLDDTFLVITYIFFVADASMFIIGGVIEQNYGLIENIQEVVSYALAAEMLYVITQMLLKIALGLFVSRIVQERWQLMAIRISVAVYLLLSIVFGFVCLFQCGTPKPLSFIFSDKCLDWNSVTGPLNYIFSISNAIVDWILTLTPVAVIAKLQMPRREKAVACVLVLFGMIGSIVSVIRIPYIQGLKLTGSLSFFSLIVPEALCSVAESGIGITALSVAALRPLWKKVVGGSSAKATSNKTYSGTSRGGNASRITRNVQIAQHEPSSDLKLGSTIIVTGNLTEQEEAV